MIPSIAAHLWQSTIFAVVAGLVAFALRQNPARVRYWIWFTASAKFLLPFSILTGLGSLLPHPSAAPAIRTEWVSSLQQFAEPLAVPSALPAASVGYGFLTTFLLAAWACGFAAVAICWSIRWNRVRKLRDSACLVDAPIEFPIPILSAAAPIEPGVFGVFRPVLLLPEGIAAELTPAQLRAILAHESCHLRRKDNFTATLHMAVQAIFWFHPLIWWIGASLIDERERACDEDVLRRGFQPDLYAAGILSVCKSYLSSPLACLSGVTGSDLKKRITAIMRNRHVIALSLPKKAALAVGAVAVIALPIAFGVAQEDDWQAKAGGKMSFEVASVKLDKGEFVPPSFAMNASEAYRPLNGRFHADFPLWTYVKFAYKVSLGGDAEKDVLARAPKWVAEDRYAIEARTPGNPTKDQVRLMMQALLAERFQVAVHFESKEFPALAIVQVKPGKLGPRVHAYADDPPCPADDTPRPAPPGVIRGEEPDTGIFPTGCDNPAMVRQQNGRSTLGLRHATMDMIASALAGFVGQGRTVVDGTGLTGRYDFTLQFTPETTAPPGAEASDPAGPTPLQALHDQLGLKLESTRAKLRILVIDKVERPSEN